MNQNSCNDATLRHDANMRAAQKQRSCPRVTVPAKKHGKHASEHRVGQASWFCDVSHTPGTDTSTLACSLPLERFQSSISPAACHSLEQKGYAVIDNVFGSDWSQKLKGELIWLKQQGKMHLNSTHLVKQGGTELLEKQNVYEAELHDPVRQSSPLKS